MMTLELHLIFVAIELILLVAGLWLYIKLLEQKRERSTPSTTEFLQNDYVDYLKSNTWQGLRERAVTRANHKCELCQAPYEVVHHIKNPKKYEEDDLGNLLVVCGSCYGKFHRLRNQPESVAIEAPFVSQPPLTPVPPSLFKPKPAPILDVRHNQFLQKYGPCLFSEEVKPAGMPVKGMPVIGGGRNFFFYVFSISTQERMLVIIEQTDSHKKRLSHDHICVPEESLLDFNTSFRNTLKSLRSLGDVSKNKRDFFTNNLFADHCTYFFDAKMAVNGRKYLKITESKRTDQGDPYRARVMIFEEDFDLFAAALKKAMSFLLKMEVE